MAFSFNKKKVSEELEESKRVQKQGWGFMETLNLYSRLIVDKLSKGAMDVPPRILGEGEFYYSTNRVFTRNGVKKMIFIRDLPAEISRGFISDLRALVEKEVYNYNMTHGTNYKAAVTLVIDGEFYDLDFSNKRIQARWNNFVRQYERVSKEARNKSLKDELSSDKYSEAVVRKTKSFLYLKEAKDEQQASFFKTKVILEIMADNDEILEVAERALKSFTYTNKITTSEVFIQTNEYMKAYSPAGRPERSLIRQMNEGDVWADDTLSSLTVTTHGKVGDELGVYHGMDIQSREVVVWDMYNGEDANNILLAAGSGEGKSLFAKMTYTFYLVDDLFSTVVFDYEGSEYEAIGIIGETQTIGMGSADGRYVNTMVIGRLTGDAKLDAELKIFAMQSTERVFNLLVDDEYGMTPEQLSIFSDALGEVYADAGVTEDPSTWHLSEGLTFFHIYSKILDMINGGKGSSKYIEIHTLERLKNFRAILRPYFEEGGSRKHWFKEPINIEEMMEAQHIRFNFDMGGKDEDSVDGKALALRQNFASHLTLMMARRNRVNGIKTVVYLEELQRYLKQKYSGDIVSNFASGGRKLGMVNYFITNDPASLVDAAEVGADKEDRNASAIMSNITMVIFGAMYRATMAKLIDYFSLHDATGYLMELADVKENNSEDAPLKHCFFMRNRGQSTIVRMMSHPELESLPLYRTVQNKHNPQLRSAKMMKGVDVQKSIVDAYKKDSEWDQRGAGYDARVKGSAVEKTWKKMYSRAGKGD
ncbi:MAG: hypothetical protein ACI35P_01665 [Bacillus sp. (in: firmicutes)]